MLKLALGGLALLPSPLVRPEMRTDLARVMALRHHQAGLVSAEASGKVIQRDPPRPAVHFKDVDPPRLLGCGRLVGPQR